MVISHPVLIAGRRTGGLDTSDEALVGQHAERVVHRLTRDRADLDSHDLGDVVRRAVRASGDRSQDRQTLSRDLQAVLAKKIDGLDGELLRHHFSISQILDTVQYWHRVSTTLKASSGA